MSNIQTLQELRQEIARVKQESNHCRASIRNSYNNFKKSLTPINLIITLLGELRQEPVYNAAITAFQKIREFFRKKTD